MNVETRVYNAPQERLEQELDRFTALMDLSDTQLKIMNSNERLGLDEERDKRLLARTLTEEQYRKSWHYINDLAVEYHGFVQQGHDRDGNKKSERQFQIESEMAQRLTPFVWKIANAMVHGSGRRISTEHGQRILSLKGFKGPIEDLVQEGFVGLIGALPKHDPERGKFRTYANISITTNIYRQGAENMGLLRVPAYIFAEARKITREKGISRHGKVYALIEGMEKKPGAIEAINIYHGLHKKWVDINGPIGKEHDSPSRDTFEGRYLDEEFNEVTVDDILNDNEMIERMKLAMKSLTSLEQDILQKRFFEDMHLNEIGAVHLFSGERIRQMQETALYKLRRKLHDFLISPPRK